MSNFVPVEPPPETPPVPWADELERGGFTRAAAPEDFDRICRAAAALEDGTERGFIFTGGAGCGKTLAATIIARRLFGLGGRPRPGDLPHLAPQMIHGYQIPQLEDDDQKRLTCFRTARCGDILLDDIGTESPAQVYGTPTDLVPEFLASFCDRQGFGGSRCIVTTNLDGNGLRARYGERIASRLLESFAWLAFKGADKRVKKARVY